MSDTDRPDDSGRMWAPWRIDYILGLKQTSCPFCDAPHGGASDTSLILALGRHAFVILNRYPYSGCHLMVVPRVHVSRLEQLSDEAYTELMSLVRASATRLQAACNPQGINLGMNLGEAAGAGIETHLHMHLVPRWAGDTNFMAVTAGTRVVSQGLEHAWATLRPHFEDLDVT